MKTLFLDLPPRIMFSWGIEHNYIELRMIPKTNQQITIVKSAFLQNYSLKSRQFKNLIFRPEQPKYLQNVGVATRPYNQFF